MNRQKKDTKFFVRIVLYFYVLLILLSLVTVASYTWFSLSRTPRVSDMNMYVNSQSRMELSLDPFAEDWQLQLDLRDAINTNAPLRPVTWVEEEQRFYAAAYGADGRLLDFEHWQPLSDEVNANQDSAHSYYIKMSLFARASTTVDVTLSPAVEVDDGTNGSGTYVIGEPIWDPEQLRHDNGGLGAETAIRIGIRITPVDSEGAANQESTFYIYEPNADVHMDGTQGYVPTPSITGAESLISEEFLIRQTASTWTESDPVERDVVVKDLGEFESSPTLFTLIAGQMVKIDLYIWLEGQDVDCISKIQEARILASLQFASDSTGQSGLKPIE